MPSEMRRSFGLTERMIVSTSSPGLTILRGVLHALGPGHFRHVDQAFDALLELDKRAVVGDRQHAST